MPYCENKDTSNTYDDIKDNYKIEMDKTTQKIHNTIIEGALDSVDNCRHFIEETKVICKTQSTKLQVKIKQLIDLLEKRTSNIKEIDFNECKLSFVERIFERALICIYEQKDNENVVERKVVPYLTDVNKKLILDPNNYWREYFPSVKQINESYIEMIRETEELGNYLLDCFAISWQRNINIVTTHVLSYINTIDELHNKDMNNIQGDNVSQIKKELDNLQDIFDRETQITKVTASGFRVLEQSINHIKNKNQCLDINQMSFMEILYAFIVNMVGYLSLNEETIDLNHYITHILNIKSAKDASTILNIHYKQQDGELAEDWEYHDYSDEYDHKEVVECFYLEFEKCEITTGEHIMSLIPKYNNNEDSNIGEFTVLVENAGSKFFCSNF